MSADTKDKDRQAVAASAPKVKGMRPKGPQIFIDWRNVAQGDNRYVHNGKSQSNWSHAVPGLVPQVSVAYGVRLEAQAGEKVGPLFACDKPWEGAYVMYVASVFQEDGRYRMWYATTPRDHAEGTSQYGVDVGLVLCYAESDDGVKWRKPDLGLVEYEGSKNNNIVYGRELSPDGYSSGAIFKDPAAPASERYKLFYKGKLQLPDEARHAAKVAELKERFGEGNYDAASFTRSKNAIAGMFGATSPDGIRWTPLREPLQLHYSDTLNNVVIDKDGNYIAYMRMRRGGRRVVGRAETKNFRDWTKLPDVVLEAPLSRHPGDDIYHGVVNAYPEGSTNFVMFATFFRQLTDGRHVELASSADSKYWNLLPGQRSVEPGNVRTWTGGDTHIGHGIVQLPNDRIGVPFVGYTEAHKAPRYLSGPHGSPGFVVWRKDRLSAIVADEIGEFSTKPLVHEGNSLNLNFETTYTGQVLVEIRGDNGTALPGYGFDDCDPVNGDHVAKKVTWRGNCSIAPFAGQACSIVFRLRAAKLFSFELN